MILASDEAEIAGSAGKTLTGRVSMGTAAAASKTDSNELTASLASKFTLDPISTAPATPKVESLDPINQLNRIEATERIRSVVSQEVTLLKSSGAGSLAVMLRPDSETEVFVQLTRNGNQVEAFVRLEKGDSTEMRQNWERLQASLAEQNIRLLPLQSSDFNSRQERSQHDGNAFQDRDSSFQQSGGSGHRYGGQSRGRETAVPFVPQPVSTENSDKKSPGFVRNRALDSWA